MRQADVSGHFTPFGQHWSVKAIPIASFNGIVVGSKLNIESV
jgi:hypothetical protein